MEDEALSGWDACRTSHGQNMPRAICDQARTQKSWVTGFNQVFPPSDLANWRRRFVSVEYCAIHTKL
jgi:hypothetical protein